MRTRWFALGLLLAVSVLLTPGTASAQIIYYPSYGSYYGSNPYMFGGGSYYGGGYYGSRGSYGSYYPGSYGYGGYGYGAMPTYSSIMPLGYGGGYGGM